MTGGEIKNTCTNSGNYAINTYSDSGSVNLTDVKIISDTSSGIYAQKNTTLNNVEISLKRNDAIGIHAYRGTVTMNGDSKIITPGTSASAVYFGDYENATFTMNNGAFTTFPSAV